MHWQEGKRLHNGKYEIEEYLGGGGFAVTYKALHTKLKQPVVIKTPNKQVQNDPEYPKYIDKFNREGSLLAQICAKSHPHIVRVSDLFDEDNLPCLVMDYIPGESLWDLVRRQGKLNETDAVEYIRQIGDALRMVHQQQIFHLDVTPPNIMLRFASGVTRPETAVLIDFGIAGDMSPPSTFSRGFGNKAFAPYELIRRGSRHATVDVYCLASSLYYAVTGKRPTPSLDRKFGDELIPPQQHVPSLSDKLNKAILMGMALEAQERPQSMAEWLNLLQITPPPAPPRKQGGVPQWSGGDITLSSDVGVDYSKLRDYLKAGKWREADEETLVVMLKVAGREEEGWLEIESIDNFPCTDLRTIDQLWVIYSNGRFGFSVQKRIWESVGGKPDADYKTWCKLGDRVGWRVNQEWVDYQNLTFITQAFMGHLPVDVVCPHLRRRMSSGCFVVDHHGLRVVAIGGFFLSRPDL